MMTEKPNACCNAPENLREISRHDDPGMTILTCQICGCRHFELSVDPGVMNLKGEGI